MINACAEESLAVRLAATLHIQPGTFRCMTDPRLTLTVDIESADYSGQKPPAQTGRECVTFKVSFCLYVLD